MGIKVKIPEDCLDTRVETEYDPEKDWTVNHLIVEMNTEVVDWLNEHNIQASWRHIIPTDIEFLNEADAIAFKLKWQ